MSKVELISSNHPCRSPLRSFCIEEGSDDGRKSGSARSFVRPFLLLLRQLFTSSSSSSSLPPRPSSSLSKHASFLRLPPPPPPTPGVSTTTSNPSFTTRNGILSNDCFPQINLLVTVAWPQSPMHPESLYDLLLSADLSKVVNCSSLWNKGGKCPFFVTAVTASALYLLC